MITGTNEGTEFGAPRRVHSRRQMHLTERDRHIVLWVYHAELATRQQIQRLFFRSGSRSLCQQRLTLLYRARYLDRLPRAAVSAPDVYVVSRRCTNGLRLLRSLLADDAVAIRRVNHHTLDHTLDIASCHIALETACRALGWEMTRWLPEWQLARQMGNEGLIPDAWLQVRRPTPEGPKTASFFLEVERSGKSHRALEEKLRRYRSLYYDGGYHRLFGTRALRVLFLVGEEYGINPDRQIERLVDIANWLGVTVMRFAPLSLFLQQAADQLFHAPIWRHPGSSDLCSLFSD